MSFQITGQAQGVVLNASQKAGAPAAVSTGWHNELIKSDLFPRYAYLGLNGKIFTAYAAAQATSLVGAAMVGLQLYNGSTGSNAVNLILLKVGGFVLATSATQTGVVLASGVGQVSAPTGQTAATRSANNFIGGAASAALATNAATFTNAPTAFLNLLHNTAAIATTGEDAGYSLDLEGSVIVPPQTYVAFASLGAAGAASSNQHHIMWTEVPA